MGRDNAEDYEDETVTEVKVEVDVSELGTLPKAPGAFHVADAEPPTTQKKVAKNVENATSTKPHPKSSPSSKLPKVVVAPSLPADTEPETLDPTYVVGVDTFAGILPAPGAEGEPDTLKPPQTMGVRQIRSSSGPPSGHTKPGIGPEEAQAMSSILEETTSTSSRNGWLDAARKMLTSEPDEETSRMRAADPSKASSTSIPDLSTADEPTEKRPRKNVTMRGIAPPPEPVPVNIPPSPPAPSVAVETRRAGGDLVVYVPPAIRDEKSFLPNLSEREGEVTDRMVTEVDDKTDVEVRPPAKPPTPPVAKEELPFETKREPAIEGAPTEKSTDTRREPSVPKPPSSKPAVVNLQEAKKAASDAKLSRPATNPIAHAPAPVVPKTMASPAVPPKKDGAPNKTLASPTAASLLMGATVPTAPSPPLPAKGATARPPPPPPPLPPPIEDAPEPKTLALANKPTPPPAAPPPPPKQETEPPASPRPAAVESSNPIAIAPSPARASAVPAPLLPDAIRRSPGLIAAAIATGVLLLVSGIGVGYTLRGVEAPPAPPAAASTMTNVDEPSPAATPTTTSEPAPKSESATPATVAVADPLDEASTSNITGTKPKAVKTKATATTPPKPLPKPHSHPKPVATTPATPATTAAPAPPPPPPPPATPKGFDPNSI